MRCIGSATIWSFVYLVGSRPAAHWRRNATGFRDSLLSCPLPSLSRSPRGCQPRSIPLRGPFMAGWRARTRASRASTGPGQLATDLARFLAALQRIDTAGGPPPGEHNFLRGAPLATLDVATRAAIASLQHEIDTDQVTVAWVNAVQAPAWLRPPVWIHGDLDSRNLLVKRGRLSAVLDFGCLGVGDPACDVMVAWKILSANTRDLSSTLTSSGYNVVLNASGCTFSDGTSYSGVDPNVGPLQNNAGPTLTAVPQAARSDIHSGPLARPAPPRWGLLLDDAATRARRRPGSFPWCSRRLRPNRPMVPPGPANVHWPVAARARKRAAKRGSKRGFRVVDRPTLP